MPAPRELPQQIPTPRTKARMQKPQGGGIFLVQIPRGARGDGYGWNWHLHNIITKNRFITTFIYIPGGLEQVWDVFHGCICIVTIWKWSKHIFWKAITF